MIDQRAAGARSVPARQGIKSRVPFSKIRVGLAAVVDNLGQSVPVRLALAMTLIALACMTYLAQAGLASVSGVNIEYLQNERSHLQLQNANLQAQAASLQALTRIQSDAVTQLKMQQADITKAIWISPTVPRVTALVPQRDDIVAAQRQSQPLAWLQHALHVGVESL